MNKSKCRKFDKKRDKIYRNYKINKGCAICRYDRCSDALDIHHRTKKEFRITRSNFSTPKVQNILKDCVVLCKICHHELHYKKRLLEVDYLFKPREEEGNSLLL